MNKVICIVFLAFIGFAAFAQSKCPFPVNNPKTRNDQYTQSSKQSIDKSKKELADQADLFSKKKYQSTVRAKGSNKKQTPRMRYN
jgi:hypothetical protein